MFISWLFDKLGYMPKVTVNTAWDFPVIKPVAKKPAAKKPKVVAKSVRKKKA